MKKEEKAPLPIFINFFDKLRALIHNVVPFSPARK
jgi:hypothetical protein